MGAPAESEQRALSLRYVWWRSETTGHARAEHTQTRSAIGHVDHDDRPADGGEPPGYFEGIDSERGIAWRDPRSKCRRRPRGDRGGRCRSTSTPVSSTLHPCRAVRVKT